MNTEPTSTGHEDQKINVKYQGGSSGPVYGLGLIGAMAFYFSRATTFQQGVLGFLQRHLLAGNPGLRAAEILD